MRANGPGNPTIRAAVRAVLSGGTLAAVAGLAHADDQQAAAGPAPAATAEAPAQIQEVVVTGSRIAVPNQTSISPVTFVSAEDIQRTGVTRVEDLLNQLPQVFADQSSFVANGSDGTASVDLRGLGAKRTLVLVDGQRLGPGDPISGGQSDINMVPVDLIENVEILTGGASSVYGADAVSGVVNFKLNDHYQGVKIIGDAGIYQNQNADDGGSLEALSAAGFSQPPSTVWAGTQRSIGIIAGLNSEDGKGNATVYFTYRNVLPVLQSQYSWSACTLGSGYVAGPSDTGGKFYCSGSATAYPLNILWTEAPKGANPWTTIGPNGTVMPGPVQYNYGALNYYQRPDESYTAGAFLHYELNEHARIYSETMFMDDYTQAQIAGSGLFGLPASDVDCANPYLSSAEATAIGCASSGPNATGTGSSTYDLYRRDVEGGGRVSSIEHMDIHQVLGLKGSINDAWTYDLSYTYSLVDLNSDELNFFSDTKAAFALNAVGTYSPAGQLLAVACAPGAPAGCVPYDPFQLGGVTAAQVAYLYTPGITVGRIYQHDAQVNLNADLGHYGLQVPAASSGLQLAIGGEYRDAHGEVLPDEESQTGDLGGVGGPTPPVAGGLMVREGYVEAELPVADDKPFAQAIDLNAGYRYSGYDLSFGDTNTYKLGIDWEPSSDIRLRASFARAVRAPNIVELFGPASIGLDGTYTADPCYTGQYTLAQCERTGVTAQEYESPALRNPAGQYNGLLGGNPQLRPETAITKSFGVGFTPSFLPGLRAQLDYYDINIQGVIQSVGGSVILEECAVDDDPTYCSLIHRGPGGSLWSSPPNAGYISDTLVNAGNLEEAGVDVDMSYRYELGPAGKLVTELIGTYIDKYQVTNPGAQYDCTGYEGPVCSSLVGAPLPSWRHRLTATWITPWNGTEVSLNWRYYGGTTLESLSGNPALNGGPGITVAGGEISSTDDHISSISYFDLSVATQVVQHVTLRLGCNNILDKPPPLIGATNIGAPPQGNGNTYPGTYDALGRFLFGEIVAEF